MSSNDSNSGAETDVQRIDRIAAQWTFRLQHPLSRADEAELEDWLERDPRHAATLAEMRKTSELLDRLRDPVLAGDGPTPLTTIEENPAEGTLARTHRVQRAQWIAAATIGVAAALVVGWATLRPRDETLQSFAQVASTEVGGLRKLSLPDGSEVQLNTDSAVEVTYSAQERRVRLTRGEAFFSVAKNPSRPFWVDTRTVAVRAVGTAFNVRYRTHAIEVLVTEGKVSLDTEAPAAAEGPPAAPPVHATQARPSPGMRPHRGAHLLIAGQKATVSVAHQPGLLSPAIAINSVELPRIGRALAWQERRLEFADVPLSEAVAEFNRYNSHKLVIGDAALETRTFGGAFSPNSYDSFVEILEQSFGILAERGKDQTVLRAAH